MTSFIFGMWFGIAITIICREIVDMYRESQEMRKPIGVTSPFRKDDSKSKYSDEEKKAINEKLESLAIDCERMPFGRDTTASFAAWIRGKKV